LRAILAVAEFGLAEAGKILRTGRDAHCLRLPQREGIDRSARPGPARLAMTITHAFRFAGHLQLHGTAEAFALVCRHSLPFSRNQVQPLWVHHSTGRTFRRSKMGGFYPAAASQPESYVQTDAFFGRD